MAMALGKYRQRLYRSVPDRLAARMPPAVYMAMLRALAPGELGYLRALQGPGVDEAGYSLDGFHRLQAIFVRVPKCATRAIAHALFGNYGGGHLEAWKYRMIFGTARFNRYFKFAFVRNPWDRLASAYHFLQQGGVTPADKRWAKAHLAPYDGFEVFVRDGLGADHIRSYIHFRPQSDFLDCPRTGRNLMDYVGQVESIAQGFEHVRSRLGVDAELTVRNKTRDKASDYRSYYTDRTAAIAADFYQRDIESFGYAFDGEA